MGEEFRIPFAVMFFFPNFLFQLANTYDSPSRACFLNVPFPVIYDSVSTERSTFCLQNPSYTTVRWSRRREIVLGSDLPQLEVLGVLAGF